MVKFRIYEVRLILGFFFFLYSPLIYGLDYNSSNGQRGHRDDFISVMPFIWTPELDEWGRGITDNLDCFMNNSVEEYGGRSTYHYWKDLFGLSCQVGDHRYFFHWGYQRMPWSEELLRFLPIEVRADLSKVGRFKEAIRKEQQRRNRQTNAMTERLLGFGQRGVQARYANAFVAILYDVHILGDYETKDTDGLASVSDIVSELSSSIRIIDSMHASDLIKELRSVGNLAGTDRERAKFVLQCLRDRLPQFILNADDGRVNMRQHFESQGLKMRDLRKEMSYVTNDNDSYVIVTKSGKYHKSGCHNLQKAVTPETMPLSKAKEKGKVAAKCCFHYK